MAQAAKLSTVLITEIVFVLRIRAVAIVKKAFVLRMVLEVSITELGAGKTAEMDGTLVPAVTVLVAAFAVHWNVFSGAVELTWLTYRVTMVSLQSSSCG